MGRPDTDALRAICRAGPRMRRQQREVLTSSRIVLGNRCERRGRAALVPQLDNQEDHQGEEEEAHGDDGDDDAASGAFDLLGSCCGSL